ncbi:hypothetical protein J0910_10970 [Nocardiopsis sp. CNT-189]|uniref:hypothetical protein n=1 Tax=Nocardiopsis oceanisediminis TaxID=2816862 RepID=UPI003B35AF93
MSYKPVVVAVHRNREVALERQLDLVMAPFLHGSRPPDGGAQCDEWWIGGYWAGRYLSTADGHPDLIAPHRFPADSPLAGCVACDGGPKHLLDLGRLRAAAAEQAWRRWPGFLAENRGGSGLRPPEERSPEALRAAFDELVRAERGRAAAGPNLLTLDGEWLDESDVGPDRTPHFRRIGDYVDALPGDAWLVCLTVHF